MNKAYEETLPFIPLDSAIESQIAYNQNHGIKSPYAFQDVEITRRRNTSSDTATILRPAFSRDVEKILNIPAYNRYADKTQVFSLRENDDISRRWLHVQLVSKIARNLSDLLGLNTQLTEAIALGHDVGHTPFGHAGEKFLSACYHAHTGRYFNHNVQSVRVLDYLYPRNISLQTLNGVLCHNGEFVTQELQRAPMNTFCELDATVEACTCDEQNIAHLRPSTLEGCVVRVSDMIAYLGKDRNDALRVGTLSDLTCFDTKVIGRTNVGIINNTVTDIINCSFGTNAIKMSQETYEDLKTAKAQNSSFIYLKEGMVDGMYNVVEALFSDMYELLLSDLLAENKNSPIYLHHVDFLEEISTERVAKDYMQNEPNQIVVDYISSMSDSYFLALYDYCFPEKAHRHVIRGYCSDLPPKK